MAGYDTLPSGASSKVEKFTVQVSDEDLSSFKELLRLSQLGPKTYENLQSDQRFGVTYEWMQQAKAYWEKEFDW